MNAAILVSAATIFSLLRNTLPNKEKRIPLWVTGLLFGTFAVMTMLFPVSTQEGMFFDFRTSIITIAALINGPIVALFAIPLPIIYRIKLGGAGVYPGIAEIIIPAILASAIHLWLKRENKKLSYKSLFIYSFAIITTKNIIIISIIAIVSTQTLLSLTKIAHLMITVFETSAAIILGSLILVDNKRTLIATELAKNKRQLNITLDSIGDAVIVCDINKKITRINPVACVLTGWTHSDAIGKPIQQIFNIIHKSTQEKVDNPVIRVFKEKKIITLAADTILVTKDNKRLYIEDSGAPIFDDNNQLIGAILVFRDVSAKIELENQLRQSHKMEAIGELTSGIAHDFNNILMGILGHTELLKSELKDDKYKLEYLEGITNSAHNATQIIKQLMAFSRSDEYNKSPVSLHKSIKSILEITKHTFSKQINITYNLNADSDTIIGDAPMLQQALLNLAINARDAMPGQTGNINFTTSTTTITGRESLGLNDGSYIKLTITDDGTGIPEDILDKIFDPFFTTKETGKGTGLGLSSTYGNIQKMHGHISAESTPGEKTVFTILLPLSIKSISQDLLKKDTIEKNKHYILIADDNKGICKLISQSLSKFKYNLIICNDGEEAIEQFHKNRHQIDLVLLDLNMPTIGGLECYHEFKKAIPALPCIFISGNINNEIRNELNANGVTAIIDKPFNLNELSQAIEDALQTKRNYSPA